MEIPPFKHKRTTLERAEKFISKDYFTDVNLRSRLYKERSALAALKHFAAPERISFADAVKGSYKPTSVGTSYGPGWSTHWFRLQLDIPASWQGGEVHLLWSSGSEALVWADGRPVQGLNEEHSRQHYIVSYDLQGPEFKQIFYVEMACNKTLGNGQFLLQTDLDDKTAFTLSKAEIALFDRDVYNLMLDIEILHDVAKYLPDENQRGYQALYTLHTMMNSILVGRPETYKIAREIARKFLIQRNGESQHTVCAMGHAHIDTAWLWPYAETIRKCARSWTNSVELMKKYPEFIFVCSQAQQYEWTKKYYPSLWKDICYFVQKGQFVPVGGTWVEMDGNMPSGEACIRQFLYGQKFFQEEFGIQCKEFWLPDTFGYSAQFPQIMQHCGITRFLTQKLSWNLFNKFPHHTFHWEGIDGSTVLAHFPPGDKYDMAGKVEELLKTVTNNKDKGRSNCSAFLFGFGDGGHGPNEDMLQRLDRLKDCDGIPKVKLSSSDDLFSMIEHEGVDSLCRWRGELYLELHNGTYTTWAEVKKGNRVCEFLLQTLELVVMLTAVTDLNYKYPQSKLEELWKLLLINQFHDVLPGTSINGVFHDAVKKYNELKEGVAVMMKEVVDLWTKSTKEVMRSDGKDVFIVNSQSFARHSVLDLSVITAPVDGMKRRRVEGSARSLVEVKIPPLCVQRLDQCLIEKSPDFPLGRGYPVLTKKDDKFVMCNDLVKAVVDSLGRVVSLKCYNKETGCWSKEAIDDDHAGNQYVLYDDVPLFWDAWDIMDYHLHTRTAVVEPLQRATITESKSGLRVSLEVVLKISEHSQVTQTISLDAHTPYLRFDAEVTWNENRKFLKVEFPTTVHTTEASYDIQSGFLRRSNHYNTSWDSARFEVCGHKWADLSEHGFGVSVLNNCKYGYSALDGVLRLSLLRSPKHPDPLADMGEHSFAYAVMPHCGSLQSCGVIKEALALNSPLHVLGGSKGVTAYIPLNGQSSFEVDTDQVVIQSVKMAEDGSKTVILRLHEAFGGSTQVKITTDLPLAGVTVCSGLETELNEGWRGKVKVDFSQTEQDCQFSFLISAFQIVTFRCALRN